MERGVQSEKKTTTTTPTQCSSDEITTTSTSRDGSNGHSSLSTRRLSADRPTTEASPAVAAASSAAPSSALAPHLQLDLFYFNFWWTVFVVATLACLFWVDILPLIGTSSSLSDFGCKMWFNLQCLFGEADCVGVIAMLGWLDFCTVLLGNFAFSGLMRHSEGANFVMIIMTVRTPIVFIFWTLFVEQPFSWQPHASLGTWLSIGSIVVMVAAIIIYDRAPSEIVARSERRDEEDDDNKDDDRQPLIASELAAAADDEDDGHTHYEEEDGGHHGNIQSAPSVKC